MKTPLAVLFGTFLMLGATAPQAAPLAIDEATYPGAGGDYNNLLSPPLATAVVFDLGGGTNTFAGTFGTPGDAGDTFLVQLGTGMTLTGVHVTFATNASSFNPVAINQGSQLVFDSASSNSPTPLLSLDLTGRPSGPVTFSSGALNIGAGIYNSTILTGVLALNNNGKVGYQVAFDVTAPAVPEPSEWAMLLCGLFVLVAGSVRRERRRVSDQRL